MKFFILTTALLTLLAVTACEKDVKNIPDSFPRTQVGPDLQGPWMYGHFSMTEYWSTNPSEYIGNANEYAIAFQFEANGTYTHYFTSSTVIMGITTYQQSVTRGTVEVDPVAKTIKTHPFTAHYKRTRNGQVEEERDMKQSELTSAATYTYTTGEESNGAKALYLTLQNTTNPVTFIKK